MGTGRRAVFSFRWWIGFVIEEFIQPQRFVTALLRSIYIDTKLDVTRFDFGQGRGRRQFFLMAFDDTFSLPKTLEKEKSR